MRLSGSHLLIISSLALAPAACNRADERRAQQEAAFDVRANATGKEITVTGCLTAAPDRGAFVVTADRDALTSNALYSGSGEVPTYTYELVDPPADLSPHANRQVAVKGYLDDRDDEVDVEVKDKTREAPARVGNDTVTAAVQTKEEIDINVRSLQVISTTPTGRPCGQ